MDEVQWFTTAWLAIRAFSDMGDWVNDAYSFAFEGEFLLIL
jgi:hypothetical protein